MKKLWEHYKHDKYAVDCRHKPVCSSQGAEQPLTSETSLILLIHTI